jgi:hypothetical protein
MGNQVEQKKVATGVVVIANQLPPFVLINGSFRYPVVAARIICEAACGEGEDWGKYGVDGIRTNDDGVSRP